MAKPTKQATSVTDNAVQANRSITGITVPSGTDLVVVECGLEGAGVGGDTAITAMTLGPSGSPVALTKLIHINPSTWSRSEVWFLKAPATGGSQILAITHPSDQIHTAIHFYGSVENVASPFLTSVTGQANSGTSDSRTVSSVTANVEVRSLITIDSTGHNPVPGADQTEEYEVDGVSGGMEVAACNQDGANGGVMSWTWTTSAPYSHIAYAITGSAAGTETTDSGTVPLALTPSGTEFKEILDSGTVRLVLTASGVELAERVDTATTTLVLIVSGTETREIPDSGSVTLAFTPSAVETREISDSGTALLALTPSATETRERFDAATVVVTFTPSGADGKETSDSQTVPLIFTPSGVEDVGNTFTDSATITLNLVPSSVDAQERFDSGTAIVALTPSAIELRERNDAATVQISFTPSSTDVREITDSATVPLIFTPSGTTTFTTSDTNTAIVTLTPSATSGNNEDFGTIYLRLVPTTTVEIWFLFDTLLSATLSKVYTGTLSTRLWSATVGGKRWSATLGSKRWAASTMKRWTGLLGRF